MSLDDPVQPEDETTIDPEEAGAELPDLDVTDEAGQSVKGGIPRVVD